VMTASAELPGTPPGTPQQMEAAPEPCAPASAKVLNATLQLHGGDAVMAENPGVCGDATEEFAAQISNYPHITSAYRLGQVLVSGAGGPAEVKIVLENNGGLPWSEAASVRHAAGPSHNFAALQLAAVPAGDKVELVLDFSFGSGESGTRAQSAWVVCNEKNEPFGPLLILELIWI